MLTIDLHIHSIASGHALNTVYELAYVAKTKGLTHIGIAEHGPSMQGAPHDGYFWISDQLITLFGINIYLGIEANIIDKNGKLDLGNELLKKQKIVLAGIHEKTPYNQSDVDSNTESIINAMKNPFVKIISHPWRPEFPVNIKEVVEASYETETLLEINDNLFSRKKDLKEILSHYSLLIKLCDKYKIPVILGSDAHIAEKIGSDQNIMRIKHKIGLSDRIIINNKPELLFRRIRL
ncbi:phosphatase YcdX [ANME-1 cluster archaeon GoMg3.2]|jgi:putative hydrolase|nr:phosphatase YcdX [ANME-1 cluster archaeon GoMg3.2]